MLRRPPQHRANAEIVYVHPLDPGWDQARIDAECEEMEAAAEGSSDMHPVVLYWRGSTRYDVDAMLSFKEGQISAADYLDDSKATKVFLRRMGARKMSSISTRLRSGDPDKVSAAKMDAAKWSVVSATGPLAPKLKGANATELTESDLDALAECTQFGIDYVESIGIAGWQASQPLTEAEKKAFAS